MSDDSLPKAQSFSCKFCGHHYTSASRWHVTNRVCADGDCMGQQVLRDQSAHEQAQYDQGLIVYGEQY